MTIDITDNQEVTNIMNLFKEIHLKTKENNVFRMMKNITEAYL